MKRLLLTAVAVLVPFATLAIDFTHSSTQYTDAPFSAAEAAGISVLTNAGVVEGNPDGSFAASRTLNRAEFVKIVLGLPEQSSSLAAGNCFPDVHRGDWFSPYVCRAKDAGLVEGYPDGYFHPERPVNYAESLKILSILFSYGAKSGEGANWYVPYATAAINHKTALPSSLSYDAYLTRGQMARLAAAFYAEAAGQLASYRALERGENMVSSSEVSSSSTGSGSITASDASASSVSVASSSTSSTSSAASVSLYPATSHFLLVGETSPPIMDATFVSTNEDATLRIVHVELFRKVQSLSSLELVDENGAFVATLSIVNDANNTDTKWEATLTSDELKLRQSVPMQLGIRAVVKPLGGGGSSNELLEPREFTISVQGTSGATYNLVGSDFHKPSHQTSLGHITMMYNTLATSMSIEEETHRQLASFAIGGRAVTGSTVRLSGLTFLLQSNDIQISNVRIGGTNELEQEGCGIERGTTTLISCPVIPELYQALSGTPVNISLFADVELSGAATAGSLQLRSIGNGAIGQNGTVQWTDGTGTFNWIEEDVLLNNGPFITVTK